MLRAGAFEVCISPPIGVELSGYGPDLGRRVIDIHDHLMAQALILDDGKTRLVIVTADVIGIPAALVSRIRDQVHKQTGIPQSNVLICVSHSHTSTTLRTMRGWGHADGPYTQLVARHLAGAVVAAVEKLQPAAMCIGHGEYHDLAWNRTGSGVIDPGLDVVRLDGQDGKPIAILTLHACHPVILGPKPILSADYPGAFRAHLAERYPGSVILFANGPCGDVDPVTNREVWGKGTFEDVRKAGVGLGEAAIQIAEKAKPVKKPRFAAHQATMELHYDLPPAEFIRDQIAAYIVEARRNKDKDERFEAVTGTVTMPKFWLGYYRALKQRIESGKQPAYEAAEIQAFTLAEDAVIVAMPAEVYAAQGLAIRKASHYGFTMPICYANGSVGYLPPRSEFDKASYTASLAAAVYDKPPYRSDVAEVLVSSVEKLLKKG